MWHNVCMEAVLDFHEYIGIAPKSEFDLAGIVENGLPPESIALLKMHGVTFTEVSEIVISPRTLKHRRARGENLSHEETDRLVRVARIIALADGVFGDHAKAMLWLRTEDDRIGGRRPLSMLQTEAGGRVVESMLWQIDEGVYS
jgi:putative toxin-antitoxin system antitoxin component (TIGR02293 family)